jgi:16S rRNA processing protein RimM
LTSDAKPPAPPAPSGAGTAASKPDAAPPRTPRGRGHDQTPTAGTDYIAVGRLGKPHGVHGEINFDVMTDFPERFKPDARFYIGPEAGPDASVIPNASHAAAGRSGPGAATAAPVVTLRSVRPIKQRLLLSFDVAGDRDVAAQLTGLFLYVPIGEAFPLEEDTYYPHQLIGLQAVTSDDGRAIGRVTGLIEVGEVSVLQIRGHGPEVMVPMVGEFIARVDVAGGQVVVNPVPGLLSETEASDL